MKLRIFTLKKLAITLAVLAVVMFAFSVLFLNWIGMATNALLVVVNILTYRTNCLLEKKWD